MKLKNISVAILVLTLTGFAGCAKKADPNKPIDQIKEEVQILSVSDLQNTAAAYAKAIKVQKAELARITGEMKNLSPEEIFSDKAQSVKNRLSQVQTESAALMERYQIYVKKLQEKGTDLSKVQLD